MNKKLLAAAIVAAMAAPMAAHADVTVYGIANASIDHTDTGAATNASSTYATSDNSSRIGVKGSQDLGGGLKAFYGMEWEVGITGNSSGDLGMRNREVGLAGDFGSVSVGYSDSPMKLLWTSYDFNITHVGDLGNVLDKQAISRNQGIQYASPKLGGSWTIKVAYQPDNGTQDKNVTDLTVDGMAGPVHLAVGTEAKKNGTGTNDTKTNRVAANMNFGMLGVNALYSKSTDVGGTSGHDLTTVALQGKLGLGGGNDIRVGLATAKFADNSNNKATMTTIGFDHNFSKMVAVYVDYATTNNKSAGQFTVDGGAHGGTSGTPGAGNDPKSLSAGIIVKF